MAIALPYSIVEYHNPRTGSVSWRVQGSWRGKRVRQNLASESSARAVCDLKNAEALREQATLPPPRLVPTRLEEGELMAVEAAVQKAAKRWSLPQILDAGLEALTKAPKDEPLEPLFRAWLKRMEHDLGARWLAEIQHRGDFFFRANPKMTTTAFTPQFFARWISGLSCKGQSRANYRNALSRFAGDMVAEGVLPINPCKGLRIARRRDKGEAPSILTPRQAAAFMYVHLHFPELRPELGWAVECLFAGLRPQNEAPRAIWKEIDLARGTQSVHGSKRGVKPRILELHPTAREWLQVVKEERRPLLAPYTRHLRQLAVKRANEWLAVDSPAEAPIAWDEDILRHTYASMRAASGIPMDQLAAEMGTSTKMIYSHYRHVRPAAVAKQFWEITPGSLSPRE